METLASLVLALAWAGEFAQQADGVTVIEATPAPIAARPAEFGSRRWPPIPPGCPDGQWIENRGQWPKEVLFLSRVGSTIVRAERGAIGLDFAQPSGERMYARLVFEGCTPLVKVEGLERRESRFSFFAGSDSKDWITGIDGYGAVSFRQIYPGVDLELRYGTHGMEYDLLFDRRADHGQFRVSCEGLQPATPETEDKATPASTAGRIPLLTGRSWCCNPDGSREQLERQQIDANNEASVVGIAGRIGNLDSVLSPDLIWSTFLGSSGQEEVHDASQSVNGDIHLGGYTSGLDFPKTPGAFQAQASNQETWAYVSRINSSGSSLVFSSVLGATAFNAASGLFDVAAFPDGRTAAVGKTHGNGFPMTPGAFDTTWTFGTNAPAGVVFVLSPLGDQLIYSTYLKGNVASELTCVAVDPQTDSVIAAGFAHDAGYPTTSGAFQSHYPKGTSALPAPVITRLNRSGSALEWSTFLAGTTGLDWLYDIVREPDGTIAVCGGAGSADFPTTAGAYQKNKAPGAGASGFVTRLNAQGSALIWSTLVGGSGSSFFFGLAVDPHGGVVAAGATGASGGFNFPTTPGVLHPRSPPGLISGSQLGVLSRIHSSGSSLIYSTYLHGDRPAGSGAGGGVAVDASGVATVTVSGLLAPMTPGGFATLPPGGFPPDGALARISPRGDRCFYSTYLGGSGGSEGITAMIADPNGSVTLFGYTQSADFPITSGAFQPTFAGGSNDGFLTRLNLTLTGVTRLGDSSPDCMGPLLAAVTRMPAAGDTSFGFYCSAAPPNRSGWLVVGQPHPTGIQVGGVTIWIDLTQPTTILPAQANEEGYVEVDFSLSGFSAGQSFATQFVFPTSGGCVASARRSTSNALVLVVQ